MYKVSNGQSKPKTASFSSLDFSCTFLFRLYLSVFIVKIFRDMNSESHNLTQSFIFHLKKLKSCIPSLLHFVYASITCVMNFDFTLRYNNLAREHSTDTYRSKFSLELANVLEGNEANSGLVSSFKMLFININIFY